MLQTGFQGGDDFRKVCWKVVSRWVNGGSDYQKRRVEWENLELPGATLSTLNPEA